MSAAQRFIISLAFGGLLAIALYLLLRQREMLNRSEQKIQGTDIAREEFSANISHEIRTPLSGILGVMHLLKRTGLDRNQQRYVDTATNSAKMLLAIINDVTSSSRLQTDALLIASEHFNLAEVIEDVASILAPEALDKGLELVCDVDPDIPHRIRGDALRLRQVLNNLLNNAIRYTSKGLIVAYVSSGDGSVEIGVRDTGKGIDPDKQKKLLQSPDLIDDVQEPLLGGLGLGLNSCRRLVKAMGSELRIDSRPGEGSRFYFRLRVDDEYREIYDWNPPQALQELSVGILSPLELQRSTIRKMLAHWKISAIQELDYDVEEKFDLAELRPCDLLIIDQTESEGAVNELIDRLRNSSHWRDTRFVHLVPQNRQGEDGSADVRLYKPISHSRLYTTVMDIVYKLAFSAEYRGDHAPAILSGRRILVAEDNDINKMIVLEILEESGADIDVAVNGADALEQLQREHYDLVLMDIQMPIMDGYEATRKIRAMGGRYESMPIIAMTAHALEGDSKKSLEIGMNHHVSKPFEPDELIALIARCIDENSADEIQGQKT
ncbi:MAG: response regulator [Gammaproteobacteria bacterium]|nr:response regulator [Gammaproteobacteria bacterium]MDH3446782.1 response regulator [Gammaproteobacteria bacterium]